MTKILVGAGAAALWLLLAHTADATSVCRQTCDHGTCVSRCVDRPDADVTIRDHDRYRHDEPGVELRAPGVDVGIGR